MSKHKKKSSPDTICDNRKSRHDYFLEARFEAGVVLEGWEVKSLRAGRGQLVDSYIVLKRGEAYLLGTHIPTLPTTSTHVKTEPNRTRKLLLHKKELNQLIGAVERKGYALIPIRLYWKGPKVKCEIALAKGKKQYDKRETEKARDWARDKARLIKAKR